MGHSFKIGLVLALSVIVITGFSQEAFSFPIGDDPTGTVFQTIGSDVLVSSFNIEFTRTIIPADPGILEKNIPGFPDVLTPPSFFEETITNNTPNGPDSEIRSYTVTSWRFGTNDKGHWENPGIVLDDGSNCALVSPALTVTCGDITITLSQSNGVGTTPSGSYDVLVYDFPNTPQFFGDIFVIQSDLSYLATTSGNQLTMMIHELANTEPFSGAAVGSYSIPIDSTSMLVADTQMNSIWISIALASAIGIAILIIRRN